LSNIERSDPINRAGFEAVEVGGVGFSTSSCIIGARPLLDQFGAKILSLYKNDHCRESMASLRLKSVVDAGRIMPREIIDVH